MKSVRDLAWLSLLFVLAASPGLSAGVHVWERQELVLTYTGTFANPYTDVTGWVDLTGPGFKKRVYGFWDGERTFRVRVLATAAGTWTWRSGSNPPDTGLAGKSGAFAAAAWAEGGKEQKPLRRG